MGCRFRGLLLINAGCVENTASRLQQTEGAPHLLRALAREGLGTGKNPSLPIPHPLPGEHILPPHGGVVVDSVVTPLSSCLGSGDCERLRESRGHHSFVDLRPAFQENEN